MSSALRADGRGERPGHFAEQQSAADRLHFRLPLVASDYLRCESRAEYTRSDLRKGRIATRGSVIAEG